MSTSLQLLLVKEREGCPVLIDFDECSAAWRENKNILKNGMFSYKKDKQNCNHEEENGKKCRKKKVVNSPFCEKHF